MNKIEKAIEFALHAHEGQKRKFTNIPYILHPLEVASIITTMTLDEDVICAGILHDTIEECNVTYEDIEREFGRRTAALVQSETEDKFVNLSRESTWKQRKEDSLLMLEHTKDLDVKILWIGDKLSNLRSFYKEFLVVGHDCWKSLHQTDPYMHKWYYESIKNFTKELENTAAYKEFARLYEYIFGNLE